MKKQTISALIASTFLLVTIYLTVDYFKVNDESLRPAYKICLGLTATLNILCFLLTIITTAAQKKTVYAYTVTVLGIFIGAILKTKRIRQVPMTDIKDFPFWPTFNELWGPYQRFFWHFSLDMLVFIMVLALSTSYQWFPKMLQTIKH